MGKYELKTKKRSASVSAFLNTIKDPLRKKDSKTILSIMKEVTGKKPVMWGDSIVGFDSYHYKYASGQEGDWPIIGFSPRKQALTIYIMPGYHDFFGLLSELGPHKTGKSCLYIKDLSKIHMPTLKKIVKKGYKDMKKISSKKNK